MNIRKAVASTLTAGLVRARKRASSPILRLLLLLTVPAHSEPARLLTHDGSAMTLSVNGDDLEISYLEVPAALREIGVASGTPLVRGHWDGKVLNGEAFAFSPGCPPIGYPVRGVVDFQGSLVVIGPGSGVMRRSHAGLERVPRSSGLTHRNRLHRCE